MYSILYHTYTKLDVLECSGGAWTKVLLKAVWWLSTSNWGVGFRLLGLVKVVEGVLKATPLLLVVVFFPLADFNSWNSFRLRVLYFGVLFRMTLLIVEVWTWLEVACQLARAAWWEFGPLHGLPEPLVWTWLDPASPLLVRLARAGLLVGARAGLVEETGCWCWLLEAIGWSEEAAPLQGVLEPLMYHPPVWVDWYMLHTVINVKIFRASGHL